MTDFDAEDSLSRYLTLARLHPERFVNPPGEIYEILLDPDRIRQAQEAAAAFRRREGLPSEDTRVGVLAEDPYVLVLRDAVKFADGALGLYNRLMVPSGAAVLPVLGDRVVLLNRFRHGTRAWHLEVPRGSFSGVGTRADEAGRELFEEIGATPREMIDLGRLHSTTGCLDEEHQLFLARIDRVGLPDKHEAVKALESLTVKELEDLIGSGAITDGPTLAVFLRARLRGLI